MIDRLEEIVESAEPQRLATGFVFTESPLWHPDGYLFFADIQRSLIYRMFSRRRPDIARKNSGGSMGLTFDLHGRLIMCEGDNRQVTRRAPDGSITVIADRWEGKRTT